MCGEVFENPSMNGVVVNRRKKKGATKGPCFFWWLFLGFLVHVIRWVDILEKRAP